MRVAWFNVENLFTRYAFGNPVSEALPYDRQVIAVGVTAVDRGTDGADGNIALAGMQRDMDAVRKKIAGAPTPRTLVIVGQDPLIAVGPDGFLGEMLVAAGAVNVAPAKGAWPRLGLEVVIAADPEVVVDCSMGTEATTATLDFWNRFPSLAAVRNGRVHPFRFFEALRPGPRLAIALEELARVLHPDRF